MCWNFIVRILSPDFYESSNFFPALLKLVTNLRQLLSATYGCFVDAQASDATIPTAPR
jgi:hypothetical protein